MLNPFKTESGYFNSVKWGGYSIAISFVRQILLIPAFLSSVGEYDYAFWLVLYSIAFMIRALNLGQLHYTSNLINLNYHIKHDIGGELLLGQGANLIFMYIQVLLGVIVSFPHILTLLSGFPVSYLIATNAQYSLILLVISRVILQYVCLYLLRLFEPVNKIQTSIKFQTLGDLLDFITVVAAIYFTHSIFFTNIIVLVVTIIFAGYVYYFVKKDLPFAVPFLKGISYKKSFTIIKSSSVLTFSFIVEKIYEVGLNLVIVRAYTALVLPQFNTSRTMSNSFFRVSNALVIPLLPGIQKEFALSNENYILNKMVVFWRNANIILLFSITAGMPFFSYIYVKWTGNKMDFDLNLLCFLFMAISLQSYSVMFYEFLKKTNASRQILISNVIKVVITVAVIFIFGRYNIIKGLGIALFAAELITLVYVFLVMMAIFKDKAAYKTFLIGLIPVILFSLSLVLYMSTLNYWIFFVVNILILAYILKPVKFKLYG